MPCAIMALARLNAPRAHSTASRAPVPIGQRRYPRPEAFQSVRSAFSKTRNDDSRTTPPPSTISRAMQLGRSDFFFFFSLHRPLLHFCACVYRVTWRHDSNLPIAYIKPHGVLFIVRAYNIRNNSLFGSRPSFPIGTDDGEFRPRILRFFNK